MEAPFDGSCLRDKWILVCRTSGRHRLASYQRLTSRGPWSAAPGVAAEPLPIDNTWVKTALPLPYDADAAELSSFTGYGCHLIFLHPAVMPWATEVASGWIFGECHNPNEALDAVVQWISTQEKLKKQALSIENSDIHSHNDAIIIDPDTNIQYIPQFPGQFDACLTYDDFSISACSHIAEQLGLCTTPRKIVDCIKNKFYLRQICEQLGLPSPRSVAFRISDLIQGKLQHVFHQSSNNDNDNINMTNNQTSSTLALPPNQKINAITQQILPTAATKSSIVSLQQEASSSSSTTSSSSSYLNLLSLPKLQSEQDWDEYYRHKEHEFMNDSIQFPVVVKPYSGAGSNFVRRAQNYSELLEVISLFHSQCVVAATAATSSLSSPQSLSTPSQPSTTPTSQPTPTAHNTPTSETEPDDASPVVHAANSIIIDQSLASLSPDDALLVAKWRYWGLADLEVSFMIEECMVGEEFDADIIIQNGSIKIMQITHDFPCNDNQSYFQEVGGFCPAPYPTPHGLAIRALVLALVQYLSTLLQYEDVFQRQCHGAQTVLPQQSNEHLERIYTQLLSGNAVAWTDVCQGFSIPVLSCTAQTTGGTFGNDITLRNFNANSDDTIVTVSNIPGQQPQLPPAVQGIWHFEGMIAHNLDWAKKYDYGPLSSRFYDVLTTLDDDDDENENNTPHTTTTSNFDWFVCVPVEINQRMGGGEVPILSCFASGVDYVVENAKLHTTQNTRIPNYFSLLPYYEHMNRLQYPTLGLEPNRILLSKQLEQYTTYIQQQLTLLSRNKKLLFLQYITQLPFNPKHFTIPSSLSLLSNDELQKQPLLKHASDAITNEPLFPPDIVYSDDTSVCDRPLCDNITPPNDTPWAQAARSPFFKASLGQVLTVASFLTSMFGLHDAEYLFSPGTTSLCPRWLYAASINYVPYTSGEIKALYQPQRVIDHPAYCGHLFWYTQNVGQTLQVPPDGFDYLGWAVWGGNTPEQTQLMNIALSSQLQYHIQPFEQK